MSEVNIDVEPYSQASREEARSSDTPFRIAVLGDFSGRANRNVPPAGPRLAGRKPILIDPDNFEDAMRSLRVELQLTTGPLRFAELDDFHPDQIYQNVPLFQALRKTRKELSNPQTFRAASARLRAPEPAPPPAPAPTGSLLDQIAAIPAAPERPPTRPPSADAPLDEAIRRIVAPHLTPKPDPRQDELVAQVDAAAAELMRSILGESDFQALEAAWRSIFFLLQRLETGTDLKIYLIDVSREELLADVLGATDLRSTGLHRLLVDEAVGTPGEAPWTVAAGLYTFSPAERDCDALARIASIARAAGAPFLAEMHPRLMGCESIAATPDTDDWNAGVAAECHAWRRLRGLPDACWLGLAMPRFLLRLPYGEGGSSTESFAFEEMPLPPDHGAYLWGNPSIACVCLLGEAFNKQGWDFRPGRVNRLEGLPIHSFKRQSGEIDVLPPAEIWITERFAGQILDQGLMPLASVKHSDAVQLVRFQSIAQPARALAGPWS